jgi:hypothetical protein
MLNSAHNEYRRVKFHRKNGNAGDFRGGTKTEFCYFLKTGIISESSDCQNCFFRNSNVKRKKTKPSYGPINPSIV